MTTPGELYGLERSETPLKGQRCIPAIGDRESRLSGIEQADDGWYVWYEGKLVAHVASERMANLVLGQHIYDYGGSDVVILTNFNGEP